LGGANLQDGTVNSNKLDAPTRALLGGAGGGFNVGPSNSYNGSFTGNGAALTNMNAANLASGVLSDARLSANVALRNANQVFTGVNTFSGQAIITNLNNSFAGGFTGNGAGLTSLSGGSIQNGTVNSNKLDAPTLALLGGGGGFNIAQSNAYRGSFTGNGVALTNMNAGGLASGVLNDARLSANVALRNANQVFTGVNAFSGQAIITNVTSSFGGTFTGNGAGLTALAGANLQDSTVNSNKLDAPTRALLGGFNPAQANAYNGSFTGNGIALTNLNAANVASGALNDARLSANVALRNAAQLFSGSNTFAGVATITNGNNTFVGRFSGNGASLTSLSGAALQDGTVNSNKLDAATRALWGGTGSGFNLTQSNSYNGSFTGNGAGLTNVNATLTTSLAGDVTGLPAATTVARIRGVNVLATAPVANQLMRYNGSAWAPGAVALGTDVSGTLLLANGGTGGGTAAAARSNLGAAAGGANTDITSLGGLTTPLSPAQGGTGLGSFAAGDLLFANSGSSLARLGHGQRAYFGRGGRRAILGQGWIDDTCYWDTPDRQWRYRRRHSGGSAIQSGRCGQWSELGHLIAHRIDHAASRESRRQWIIQLHDR
jgi:hypothetical protein